MNDFNSTLTWQEFFLQLFVSHWVISLLLVLIVSLLIVVIKRINATTRHNVWLLTVLSIIVMPLVSLLPITKFQATHVFSTMISDSSQIQTDSRPIAAQSVIDSSRSNTADGSDLVTADSPTSAASDTTGVTSTKFDNKPINPQKLNGMSSIFPLTLAKLSTALLFIWIAGMLLLVRQMWREYRAARELELQSDSVTPYFERRFDLLCAALGIRKRPLLRFHAGINAPMTVGLFRVWVAIPMTWREQIDDDIFNQTLTHELGHIARKDPVVNTFQRFMMIVFWLYPHVWFVARQLELERESACDDWVLTHDGNQHIYANNLLNVAESLYLQPHVLAVGCLRSHSQLSRRIQNLLNKVTRHDVSNSWKETALASGVLLASIGASAYVLPHSDRVLKDAVLEKTQREEQAGRSVIEQIGQQDALVNLKQQIDVIPQVENIERDLQASIAAKLSANSDANQSHLSKLFQNSFDEPFAMLKGHKRSESVHLCEDQNAKFRVCLKAPFGAGKVRVEFTEDVGHVVSVWPKISKQNHALLYAAWENDISKVKNIVQQQGVDVNHRFDRATSPNTAMEAAVLGGHLGLVEELLKLGADIHPSNYLAEQLSPLSLAALAHRQEIAKKLLNQGALVDELTYTIAVQNGDQDMVKLLLRRDQKFDGVSLLNAVNNNDAKMTRLLLRQVQCRCFDLETALLISVKNNNDEISRMLLDAGAKADPDTVTLAIQNRDKKLTGRLLAEGAQADSNGLMMAIVHNDISLAKKILASDVKPAEGAVEIALVNEQFSFVRKLIESGAPIGSGSLVMAVQKEQPVLVESLLESGVPIESGALIIAIQQENYRIVEMLLNAGADVSSDAWYVAQQQGSTRIIDLLKSRKKRLSGKTSFRRNNKSFRHEVKSDEEHRGVFPIQQWPAKAALISLGFHDNSRQFGGRDELHEAIDLVAPHGSEVYVVATGIVIESKFDEGYGNYVVVDHENGYYTKYANNKKNLVSKGDRVAAQQVIALVGNSAKNSAKSHLHFEVKYHNISIDPEIFLTQ